MLKLIPLFALVYSVSAFSVSDCKNIHSNDAYPGEINEESVALSFGNCPDSVLVNKDTIARLAKIINIDGEMRCAYRFNQVIFHCSK